MASYEESLALPPELAAEQEAIARRRMIAQAMMQQAQEPLIMPQGGRLVVPVSPFQGIAKLAKSYLGAKGVKDSEEASKSLAERSKAARMEERAARQEEMARIIQAGAGSPEISQPPDALGGGPGRPAMTGGRDKLIAAMAQSRYPDMQGMALQQQMKAPINLGRSLIDPNTYKTVATDDTFIAEQQMAREQRQRELEMKLNDSRVAREEKIAAQKELAAMQIESRKELSNVTRHLAPAPTVTEIVKDGRIVKVDARTMREIGTSPADLQTDLNRKIISGKEMSSLVDKAIEILNPSDKSKQKPTSSYIGAGLDLAGRAIGYETPGAGEAAQLEVLAGILTSKVPRMEGPQGVYDVKLYQEMAGQVGNRTLPISTRIKALAQIKKSFGDKEFINIDSSQPAQEPQPTLSNDSSVPSGESKKNNVIPESVKQFLRR